MVGESGTLLGRGVKAQFESESVLRPITLVLGVSGG